MHTHPGNAGSDVRNRDGNPVVHAMTEFSHLFTLSALVVAGDFNSNAMFRGSNKPGGFRAIQSVLEKHNLTNAYHCATGESFGKESVTTHYHNLGKDIYHIDYVFLPEAWTRGGFSASCGDHETWVVGHKSDHVPVIVDIADNIRSDTEVARQLSEP